MDPIRIFVGTDVNSGCAENQLVYEYSLKKHASVPVEITWMKISNDPNSFWHGWDTSLWSTPFSGFRWGVPEASGFKGKSIYTDDDQVWLTDVAELFDNNMDDDTVCLAKWNEPTSEIRYCVTLWNNEVAQQVLLPVARNKKIPTFHQRSTRLVSNSGKVRFFDPDWNNYDGENSNPQDIKLLHLTDMSSNPGIKLALKRLGNHGSHWYNGEIRDHRRPEIEKIFYDYYNEALESGYKIENYLSPEHIDYLKQDQSKYISNNGYDVTQGQ